MSFFCFPQARRAEDAKRPRLVGFDAPSVVGSKSVFDAELMAAARDDQLVAVLWTASWCRLDGEATAEFERMAPKYRDTARFIVCDVDAVPALATEYSVHDLPSFHVFHDASLVERLPGLRNLDALPELLSHHSDLAAADKGAAMMHERCSMDDWSKVPHSPQTTPSTTSSDGSRCSCNYSDFSSQSDDAAASCSSTTATAGSSERTYLPRYVQSQHRSKSLSRSSIWSESTFSIHRPEKRRGPRHSVAD